MLRGAWLLDGAAAVEYPGGIRSTTDPEAATAMPLGAIFYRRLMTSRPFNPEDGEQLVTLVLG